MGTTAADFQRLSWSTKIVVKLALAEQDIHVLPFVPGQTSFKPWFDFKGLPLRWNLPTGVLFDLLAGEEELPWELTVHFSTYPDELLPWDSAKALQDVFFNSLKESCHICCRAEGSNAVMRLSSAARQRLWEGVEGCEQQQYLASFNELNMKPEQRLPGSPSCWSSIPVRLIWRAPDAGWLSTWEHCYTTTRPFPAFQAENVPTTVLHVLQTACPGRLKAHSSSIPATSSPAPGNPSHASEVPAEPSPAAAQSPTGSDPLTAGTSSDRSNTADTSKPEATVAITASMDATQQGAGAHPSYPGLSISINGIQPPLDTPIAWLHSHLHAPDYFLYVVVHSAAESS